jgi:hypothetical protein
MEKRLPPNLTEFSTTVLILAIYRKNKDVIREQQTELSTWVPTAKSQARTLQFDGDRGETWPPSSPLLSKWRNSACDSLDILHWSANSKVARAGGWEHPTILQLHLSRLIILAPTEHMQDLASLSLECAAPNPNISAVPRGRPSTLGPAATCFNGPSGTSSRQGSPLSMPVPCSGTSVDTAPTVSRSHSPSTCRLSSSGHTVCRPSSLAGRTTRLLVSPGTRVVCRMVHLQIPVVRLRSFPERQ